MPYKFSSIQSIDIKTGFVVREIYKEEICLCSLSPILMDLFRIAELVGKVPINEEMVIGSTLLQRLAAPGLDDVKLQVCVWNSSLPYLSHGGREFDLMKRGVKPFSIFSCVPEGSELQEFLARYFQPEIEGGKLNSLKIIEYSEPSDPITRTFIYALPGEEWRFKLYSILREAKRFSKWNDALEYIEGRLLGYSKENNELWLKERELGGNRWGLHKFYMIMREEELDSLDSNGFKAIGRLNSDYATLYFPHLSDMMTSVIQAVRSLEYGNLIELYLPLYKLMPFSMGVIHLKEFNIEIFKWPSSEIGNLNRIIDGSISVVPVS